MGKVDSGTLIVRGGSNVPYQYCYSHPLPQATGIGSDGFPNIRGQITLFREGESEAPMVDDKITCGGNTFQIERVTAENNADEADGWAVYQLIVT